MDHYAEVQITKQGNLESQRKYVLTPTSAPVSVQHISEDESRGIVSDMNLKSAFSKERVLEELQQFADAARHGTWQQFLGIVTSKLKTHLSVLAWAPLVLKNPRNIKADVIAGVTVGVMVIPQSMSYASIAGLPYVYGARRAARAGRLGGVRAPTRAHHAARPCARPTVRPPTPRAPPPPRLPAVRAGMYSAFVPTLVYALLGNSRQLAVGPVAMVSLLIEVGLRGLLTAEECPAYWCAGGGVRIGEAPGGPPDCSPPGPGMPSLLETSARRTDAPPRCCCAPPPRSVVVERARARAQPLSRSAARAPRRWPAPRCPPGARSLAQASTSRSTGCARTRTRGSPSSPRSAPA